MSGLNDDFDEEAFADGESEGTEEEVDVGSADKDDMSSGSSSSDAMLEDEYKSEPSSEDESDSDDAGFIESLGVPVDGSLRMEYNDIELRQLKVVHVDVPSVPSFMDISMVDEAICDPGLTLLANLVGESEELEIKKGMVFDTLEHLKYFLWIM